MFERTRSKRSPGRSIGRFGSLALAALVATAMACEQAPTGTEVVPTPELSDPHVSASTTSMTKSSAPFKVWHQGFNGDTDGWFGAETPGELGWCGSIEQVNRSDGAVRPSAGRGHAIVSQGSCNELWNSNPADGGFGPGLDGAPWAPGPEFSAFSGTWPTDGYVMELDIYLDPAWTAASLEEGTFVFEPGVFTMPPSGDAVVNETIFAYSVSFMHLEDDSFRYLWVQVEPGDGELLVGADEHPITQAGWYTFRHVFRNDAGDLAVDFELADRQGGTLHSESPATTLFSGEQVSDFSATNVGSGYAWFTSISPGLDLPIDEYRVRRGQ